MNVTFNEFNWPLFDGISAISASKVNNVLAYWLYGKVDEKSLKYACKRGNTIEEALFKYLKFNNLILASNLAKTSNQRTLIIRLCWWFKNRFPKVKLKDYQQVIYKEPYACILDFKLEYANSQKEFIIELKTNNSNYHNKLLDIMWDIQCYILSYCSNLPVYLMWVKSDKTTSKYWMLPADYNLPKLINYLLYLNSLEKDMDFKLNLIKEYFKENNINYGE